MSDFGDASLFSEAPPQEPIYFPGTTDPITSLPPFPTGTPGIAPGPVPTNPGPGTGSGGGLSLPGALGGLTLAGPLGAIVGAFLPQLAANDPKSAAGGIVNQVEQFVTEISLHLITITIALIFLLVGVYLLFKDQIDPQIASLKKTAGEAAGAALLA